MFDKGHIYSCAMVNNFRTNFQPVQSGDVLFRYAMTSCGPRTEPGALRDFGRAQSAALVSACVLGPQQGLLPPRSGFSTLDRDNVTILALKAAEDGDGLIIRLSETKGREVSVAITLPSLNINLAFITNIVEVNQTQLLHNLHSICVQIPAYGIVTIRCCDGRIWPVGSKLAHF